MILAQPVLAVIDEGSASRVGVHASRNAEVNQSANPQPIQVAARTVVSLMAKAARAVNTMATAVKQYSGGPKILARATK